jgi:hypothetical protein
VFSSGIVSHRAQQQQQRPLQLRAFVKPAIMLAVGLIKSVAHASVKYQVSQSQQKVGFVSVMCFCVMLLAESRVGVRHTLELLPHFRHRVCCRPAAIILLLMCDTQGWSDAILLLVWYYCSCRSVITLQCVHDCLLNPAASRRLATCVNISWVRRLHTELTSNIW